MVRWNWAQRAAQIVRKLPDRRHCDLFAFVAIALNLCTLGCSWTPIKELTSLSLAVEASAVGYNDAVGNAADQYY